MSYCRKIEWNVVPEGAPLVRRSCSKCGVGAGFRNMGKFRVNANKNRLDVWLIYQCEVCRSTWNLTVYERVSPGDIEKEEYRRFMENDEELAVEYGFDKGFLQRNRAAALYEGVVYEIAGEEFSADDIGKDGEGILSVEIVSRYAFDLRADKVICQKLGISRSRLKKLYEDSAVLVKEETKLSKLRVKDRLEVKFRVSVEK